MPQCDVVYDYSEDRQYYLNKILSEFIEIYIIQLPLFKWDNLSDSRNKWIGIFCVRDKMDVEKLMKEGSSMQEMIGKLEVVSADKKLRRQIQTEEDAEREYISYTNAL